MLRKSVLIEVAAALLLIQPVSTFAEVAVVAPEMPIESTEESAEDFDFDCCQYNVYYGKCVSDKRYPPNNLRCKLNDGTMDRYSCTDFLHGGASDKSCEARNNYPLPVGSCKDAGKKAGDECRWGANAQLVEYATCDGREGGNTNPTFRCIKQKGKVEAEPAY